MTEEKFQSKLLFLDRISHTRAGGRRIGFRALVAVGNFQGKVGVGLASAKDVREAIEKAERRALKSLIEVPIVEGTIPHEVFAKYCSARVLLKPQRKGRGLIAGQVVKTICQLAGIQDISSKILSRSPNKINQARATICALKKLKKEKFVFKEQNS